MITSSTYCVSILHTSLPTTWWPLNHLSKPSINTTINSQRPHTSDGMKPSSFINVFQISCCLSSLLSTEIWDLVYLNHNDTTSFSSNQNYIRVYAKWYNSHHIAIIANRSCITIRNFQYFPTFHPNFTITSQCEHYSNIY